MAEKNRAYEAEMMTISPLYMVVGDVPVPDLQDQPKASLEVFKLDPKMEGFVKRLIAYLKDEK